MVHIRKRVLKVPQAVLAGIAGTTQGTVSRWEAGKLEPTREQMSRIRDEAKRRGLDWKDDWFFDAESIPEDTAEAAA